MSRPEAAGPPELYYSVEEAHKYTHNSRIIEIQAEMAERAIELLEIEDPETSFVLDIGCGSGISGNVLTDEGFTWIGVDISGPMLKQAKDYMEAEGDLVLADMGAGLPFIPGVFDGAISISAIQWLCHANKRNEHPERRLLDFFQSLFVCMVSPLFLGVICDLSTPFRLVAPEQSFNSIQRARHKLNLSVTSRERLDSMEVWWSTIQRVRRTKRST